MSSRVILRASLAVAFAAAVVAPLSEAEAKRARFGGGSSSSPTSVPSTRSSAPDASAAQGSRSGSRMPLIVPIVGLSTIGAGTIVKVTDLPDTEQLRRGEDADAVYVDLGYKFTPNGQGDEWVGYIGSSRKYLQLTGVELDQLVKAGGLSELPSIPSRSSRPAAASPDAESASDDAEGDFAGIFTPPMIGLVIVMMIWFARRQIARPA